MHASWCCDEQMTSASDEWDVSSTGEPYLPNGTDHSTTSIRFVAFTFTTFE